MTNQLYPCLWFDGKIAEATQFYCSLFSNSKKIAENNIITKFEIEGMGIKLLNGGALFKVNASVSFFVKCETKNEIDNISIVLENCRTPFHIVEEYIEMKEKQPLSVNKKRKEIERNIQNIVDQYKTVDNDVEIVSKYNFKCRELNQLNDQLLSTEKTFFVETFIILLLLLLLLICLLFIHFIDINIGFTLVFKIIFIFPVT